MPTSIITKERKLENVKKVEVYGDSWRLDAAYKYPVVLILSHEPSLAIFTHDELGNYMFGRIVGKKNTHYLGLHHLQEILKHLDPNTPIYFHGNIKHYINKLYGIGDGVKVSDFLKIL